MNATRWSRRHVRFVVLLTLVVAAAGIAAGVRLPVALFPPVSYPRVRIRGAPPPHASHPRVRTAAEAGAHPAERMSVAVTPPVEEAVRAVPGVRQVRSTTSRGDAQVLVDFDWGEDMLAAMLQVESQV